MSLGVQDLFQKNNHVGIHCFKRSLDHEPEFGNPTSRRSIEQLAESHDCICMCTVVTWSIGNVYFVVMHCYYMIIALPLFTLNYLPVNEVDFRSPFVA